MKYIVNFFSQTIAQILMKLGSYMHRSKVYQICSNQVCFSYIHQNYFDELHGSFEECMFVLF